MLNFKVSALFLQSRGYKYGLVIYNITKFHKFHVCCIIIIFFLGLTTSNNMHVTFFSMQNYASLFEVEFLHFVRLGLHYT